MSHRIRSLFIFLALALTACGGSGRKGDPRVAFVPDDGAAGFDGFVSQAGDVDTTGTLKVGDEEGTFGNDFDHQAFVSFTHRDIPDNAVVLSATLTLHQTFVSGDPYDELGDLTIHHVDIGPSLDPSDFGNGVLAFEGAISTSAALGRKRIDVTSAVVDDLEQDRGRSQFRLTFANFDASFDDADDLVFVRSSNESPSDELPHLLIIYQLR